MIAYARRALPGVVAVYVVIACGSTQALVPDAGEDGGGPSQDQDGGASSDADALPLDDVTLGADARGEEAGPPGIVLSVGRIGDGVGSVTSDLAGIDCGAVCAATFSAPTVRLLAAPSPGSDFGTWTGACSGTGLTCDVPLATLGAPVVNVGAEFVLPRGTLDVARSGTGTGRVTGPGIDCGGTCTASPISGTTLTLTPAPDSGSVFSGWSACPSIAGETCSLTVTKGPAVTVSAAFDACPAVGPGGTTFVDHALGRDDPRHGGQSGRCAFRTLGYALTRATDRIVLASGQYPGSVDAAPPYYLMGRQAIVGDVTNAANVVFSFPSSVPTLIIFSGSRNGVDHVTLLGPAPDAFFAIRVAADPPSLADMHFVSNNVFDNVLGIRLEFSGTRIEGNTFVESHEAIDFTQPAAYGTIIGNTFSGTPNIDIFCAGGSPGLTGMGNVRGSGSPVCSECDHCPF